MKKVLILANMDEVVYQFRRQLVERLVREGIQTVVAAADGPYFHRFDRLGVKRVLLPVSRHGSNPVGDMIFYRRCLRLIRRENPDAVLTFTIKPNCYGGLAARKCGVPFAANITGIGEAFQRRGPVRMAAKMLTRRSLKGAARVFFQNRVNLETFVSEGLVDPARCVLLPGSGVDLEAFPCREYPEEKPLRFLLPARFCRSKGVAEYIRAAELFGGRHPGCEFHFAGLIDDERLYAELRSDAVIFHPRLDIDAMPDFIAGMHAVVLPSYHEGLSNVLLEAMATGRPVLASDIPGCRECVRDDCGLLFRPRSAEALAECLERFAAMSPGEHAAMGLRGRRAAEEHFSRETVVARYMEFLKNAWNEKKLR